MGLNHRWTHGCIMVVACQLNQCNCSGCHNQDVITASGDAVLELNH